MKAIHLDPNGLTDDLPEEARKFIRLAVIEGETEVSLVSCQTGTQIDLPLCDVPLLIAILLACSSVSGE